MLVLSRLKDEKVIIRVCGHRIEVKVVEIRRGLVRLGFDAPKEVVIDREEIDAAKVAS